MTRRAVLAAVLGASVGLAGCSGTESDGEVPEPVSLTQSDECEVCGMVIPNHPGPSTEIFYADQQPSGHDNPAVFDSTWEAFQYDFDRQDRGWSRQVFYVTDYTAVEYELITDAGDTLISTHPDAASFAEAGSVTFVVGSEVKGAMGRDLIAFSDSDEAAQFREEWGGDLLAFDDVARETIAQLGRG